MSEGHLRHQSPTSVGPQASTNERAVWGPLDQREGSGVEMINTNTDLLSSATVTIRGM